MSIDPARILMELDRRKRANPLAFVEPPNDKILNFWKSNNKIAVLNGGNRSGKTESAAIEVCWNLLGNHPYKEVPKPPVFWRCEVSDYNQLEKVVLPKLMRLLPPSAFKEGKFEKSYNSRTHILTLANGSKLDFVTHDLNVLALEGAALHGVWHDEEPPEDHFKSNIMRTIDYGGRVILTFTPLQGLSWAYSQLFLRAIKDKSIFITRVTIYENKFLSQKAIEEVEASLTTEAERESRLYGKFVSLGGLVFPKFDPEVHVYTEDQVPSWWENQYPPSYLIHGIGIDPGWDHPTGVMWLAIDPNTGDHYFYGEHKQNRTDIREHCDYIKEFNSVIGLKQPTFVIDSQASAKDATGNQIIAYYQKEGIYPKLGSKKLLAGNMWLDQLMTVKETPFGKKTRFHVSADCTDFIYELSTYQRKQQTGDIVKAKEEFIDKNNDLISAARYIAWDFRHMDFMEELERADTPEGRRARIQAKKQAESRLMTGY